MLRLAILSYWHVHAKDYARDAEKHADAVVTTVWDSDVKRGEAAAAVIRARFEPDLATVLADPEIDGVIVTTPTTAHREVMTAAAKAGKHIFTEKVIAATLEDAKAILAAVDEAGVVLVVSLPRLANGYTQVVKRMIDDGELGAIGYFRMRVGHDGALATSKYPNGWLPEHFYNLNEAAGGALIDLGAHPLYLTRYLVGLPDVVTAQFGYVTGREVEDHAVISMRFASGALAVAEVSFIDSPGTFELEVHGSKGIIRYAAPKRKLVHRPGNVRGEAMIDPVVIDEPAELPSAFEQWVECIQQGRHATENVEIALDLTHLAEAANRSAREGTFIAIERG
jgi:1,5-anhydro-D-fructose reductase (1,5-anhydro-D-mannitol-forming)